MRFTALDSLRGICALLVALYHFPAICAVTESAFIRNSWLFVDFFFVLSGFIIAFGYSDNLHSLRDLVVFVQRRFARVWPLQAFTLLLLVSVQLMIWILAPGSLKAPFALGGRFDPLAIFTNLFLLNAVNIHPQTTWNIPSWSIGAEFYTYILFGLTCIFLRSRPTIAYVCFFAAACAFLFFVAPSYALATYDFGMIRCIYGFFVGCVAFNLYRLARRNNFRTNTALEAAAAIAVAIFICLADHGPLTLLGPTIFAFAIIVFAFQTGKISDVLCWSGPRKLGLWSYSVYMVHYLLVDVFRGGLKMMGRSIVLSELTTDAVLVLFIVATIGLASLTYRFVEEPSRAYINKLGGSRFRSMKVIAERG